MKLNNLSIIESKSKLTLDHQRKFLEFAKEISSKIENNKQIKIKNKFFLNVLGSLVRDWNLRAMIRWKIKVDNLKCTKCGICAEKCIAQCIILDPYPKIQMKKCVVCLACINLCPNDAINSKNTIGKERYRGPPKLNILPI
ncbi:MAG: 4Fe-4S binding protein [Promethearchaeota archaeon]